MIKNIFPLWHMTDAFDRYFTCHVRHGLVLLFIHKGWCHQNKNYS